MESSQPNTPQHINAELEAYAALLDAGKKEEAQALLEKLLIEGAEGIKKPGLVALTQKYLERRNAELAAYASFLEENTDQLEELDKASQNIAEKKEIKKIRKALE